MSQQLKEIYLCWFYCIKHGNKARVLPYSEIKSITKFVGLLFGKTQRFCETHVRRYQMTGVPRQFQSIYTIESDLCRPNRGRSAVNSYLLVLWLFKMFTTTICVPMSGVFDVMAGNDRITYGAYLEPGIPVNKVLMTHKINFYYISTAGSLRYLIKSFLLFLKTFKLIVSSEVRLHVNAISSYDSRHHNSVVKSRSSAFIYRQTDTLQTTYVREPHEYKKSTAFVKYFQFLGRGSHK